MILQNKNIHMVKIYDNILPENISQRLIELFETNKQHQQFVNHNNCPCFTQLNVNQVSPDTVRFLAPCVVELYKRYKKDIKNKYAPPLNLLEEFRIKKYDTSGNQRFDEHVDITDFDSSIRAISFLFYLNDNDGNTLFPLHNLNIQPVSGRVIVFPPTWEYPHQGLAPKSNPKYIMSTYVHYGAN